MSVLIALFLAGIVTILLPCILPLLPIVLGVSVAGRSRLRPLVTILGMVVSFVTLTFILQVFLAQFVTLADAIQISTYYVLLLFGICFLTESRMIRVVVALLGGFFYWKYGWIAMTAAEILGVVAVDLGGRIANNIQQLGAEAQQSARGTFGNESPLAAFIIGLTLGLVWVPCAGPALGFALALIRTAPGSEAVLALTAYAAGAAIPLLVVAYGGQWAVHSVRSLSRISGRIKQVAGAVLILTALGFQYGFLVDFQVWLTDKTGFGRVGSRIEEALFSAPSFDQGSSSRAPVEGRALPQLPKLARAPEFSGLGPWYNSQPLTLQQLRGKVVLIDFWTYSCINCIRTLPYMRGYWGKFKEMPFVLIGIHTPEFVFEKDPGNVKDAIERHKLTYPIAQDNDYRTWDAFNNRYWPAKYLIDAEGYVRYTHFGEGNYEETDLAIQSLLAELGMQSEGKLIGEDETEATFRDRSPETYLGERSWSAFANAQGNPDEEIHSYAAPSSLPLHQYALVGDWQMLDGERQVLRGSSGEIHYRALASEVNLVLGLKDPKMPGQAEVIIDGKSSQTFAVDKNDLFNLYKGEYGEHEIVLKLKGKGVEAYAFTFGA